MEVIITLLVDFLKATAPTVLICALSMVLIKLAGKRLIRLNLAISSISSFSLLIWNGDTISRSHGEWFPLFVLFSNLLAIYLYNYWVAKSNDLLDE